MSHRWSLVLFVLVLGRWASRGQPHVGVPVLFHDAGGALITRAVTASDGRESADELPCHRAVRERRRRHDGGERPGQRRM